MPKCMIRGCPHKSGEKRNHPDVILHKFPSNAQHVMEWLKKTGHHFDDLDDFVSTVLEDRRGSKFRICSNHFTDESYTIVYNRRVLNEFAIPTINLEQNTGLVVERTITRHTKKNREDAAEAHHSMAYTDSVSTVILACRINPEQRDVGTQTEINVQSESGKCSFCERSLEDNERILSEHSYYGSLTEPLLSESMAIKRSIYEAQPDGQHIRPTKRVYDPLQFIEEHHDRVVVKPALGLCQNTVNQSSVLVEPSRYSDCMEPHRSELAEGSATSITRVSSEDKIVSDRKFIVFESCLDKLFCKLMCGAGLDCSCPVEDFKKIENGSFLSVIGICKAGHSFLLWESQPVINNIPAGNLLFSASLLFSGSDFKKVEEMSNIFGVQQISEACYHRYQRQFLFPTVHHEWQLEKDQIKESLTGKSICVGGDGQCDGLGLSTKYCVYTMIDLVSKRIIDFEVTQPGQCTSSVALENKALEICLNRIIEENVDVHIVATDRHASTGDILREKFPQILHQFDIWRYAKNLREKLDTASQKEFCAEIGHWTDAIIKHFWWSALTCDFNVDLLKEKWESVLNHVINVHEWSGGRAYHRCAHEALSEERARNTYWLRNDTCAFETLVEIVKSSEITKDLEHLTHFCHMAPIETFHSHSQPKGMYFETDAVRARTALAALAHNNHLKRDQDVIEMPSKANKAVGTKTTRIFYPKSKKRRTLSNIYESKSNSHIHGMMVNVLRLCSDSLTTDWHTFGDNVPQNMATVPRPDTAAAAEGHWFRFKT